MAPIEAAAAMLDLVVEESRRVSDFRVLAEWETWLRSQALSHDTIRLYAYGVFRFFFEHVRGPIDAARPEHVDRFLASFADRGSARVQYFRGLRSLFRFATARGYAAEDPTIGQRMKKPAPVRPRVVLSTDELIRILVAAAWRDPRRAWAMIFAYSTGTRRGELASIAPRDLDLENGSVYLRKTKGDRPRRVELGPLAMVAASELRPWWTEESILGGINAQTITDWGHEAASQAGLYEKVRGRSSHVFRASFATHMLRAGVPVQVVRDLMGHTSIATTNYYAVAEDEERRAAVDRVFRLNEVA